MKLYQFCFVFLVIFLVIAVTADIKTNNLKAVIDNKEQIDKHLDIALDDGVTKLAEVDDNNKITISKAAAVNSIFMSLYSTFGIMSDKNSQEKLNLYIPVVTIMMEDGYYIFYSDEFTASDGHRYISKRWSEKFPFYYEDNDFIYSFTLGDVITIYDKNNLLGGGVSMMTYNMDFHDFQTDTAFASFRSARPNSFLLNDENFDLIRKSTILKCLEDSMSYYTSRHNRIASQYGIAYTFSFPSVREEEWKPYLNNVAMFVVFQGYPYGSGIGEAYNKVAAAGAKVTKSNVYYIEQKGWYLIYHKATCPELLKEGIILKDEPYYDPELCIKLGCYQCPICFPNGIYAPDYTP
ncbi:MAG TPA: hypothetical protein VN258_13735 [Mobilitalea sp.]|nr:hypothetical protein [Mobilitalea sp.]